MESGPARGRRLSRAVLVRTMIAAAACLSLASLLVSSVGLAQSPGSGGEAPANAGTPPAPHEESPAGAPFLTYALAFARGDYELACDQVAKVVLRKLKDRSLRAARKVCARLLRSHAEDLDEERLRSLLSSRIVKVRVDHHRARVTVQTTFYGLEPRATGSAVREGGRWKIAELPTGEHVGRSLVKRTPSGAMIPTLNPGDTVLVDQDAYLQALPAIGDIVVFHPPAGAEGGGTCAKRPPKGQACAIAKRRDSKALFIKRIVAGPGDQISIRDGHVIRNGTPAAEDFITPCGPDGQGCDFPLTFTVAPGRYYVLGDNRGESIDSRQWGPVAPASIIGRAQRLGP